MLFYVVKLKQKSKKNNLSVSKIFMIPKYRRRCFGVAVCKVIHFLPCFRGFLLILNQAPNTIVVASNRSCYITRPLFKQKNHFK